MKLSELKNKKILIVGHRVEGQAAYDFLSKHFPDQKIDVADRKEGDNYLSKQEEYDIAIKSPGVRPEVLKIPHTTLTNIFFANARGKIIGVTGTKGKSTTSTLIFEILKKQGIDVHLGGNIGISPVLFLDKLNDFSWTVLELSSFQLSDIKFSPHIAVLLMMAEEHLDYHGDIFNYIEAKRNILRYQTTNDFAILNRDYPPSNESDIFTEAKVFKISRDQEVLEGCFLQDDKIILKYQKPHSLRAVQANIKNQIFEKEIIDISDIKLSGKHNLENACAAVMAAYLAGVKIPSINSVLKGFKGLEHRLEYVGEYKGITFYNDSLATIPEATIEAVEALGEVETLIAGGHDRGLDFSKLGEYISNSSIKNLILFPTTGSKIWEALAKALPNENLRPKKFEVNSMKEAVTLAFKNTTAGKICLMSPASASFGMFKNYKDRGEQFKKEVQNLR